MAQRKHYLVDDTGTNVYYISLVVNPTFYSVTLSCTPIPTVLPEGWSNPGSVPLNGYVPQLVTGSNNWAKLIGYANNSSFPATLTTANLPVLQYNSTLTPQITPITSVYVTTNLVTDASMSTIKKGASSILQTFNSTGTTFGSLISFYPTYPLFYEVTPNTYSQVTLAFYDQNFNPLVMNDTNQITAMLVLQTTKN